jgi:hypothetical protein
MKLYVPLFGSPERAEERIEGLTGPTTAGRLHTARAMEVIVQCERGVGQRQGWPDAVLGFYLFDRHHADVERIP